MLQDFIELQNWDDQDGNPAGGRALATGLDIHWQNAPLGTGLERKPPSGAFVETVLKAVEHRLEFYQSSKFECAENAAALAYIRGALHALNKRTRRRERDGVEGTHNL